MSAATNPFAARIPPHNFEAEQALLGAIFERNSVYERVSEYLRPEHFADPVHGRIYATCGKLIDRGQMANPVTLKTYFENDGGLAEIGGISYLAQLANAVVSVLGAPDYARLVHDLHLRRELIGLGQDIVDDAHTIDLDRPAGAMIETAEAQLATLAETGTNGGGARPWADVVRDMVDDAEAARQRGGGCLGLSTGLADLDDKLGGLAPGNLLVLGARPSMGKSSLAFGVARHVASTQVPTGIFSLEMTAKEVGQRLASDATGIPFDRIRRGKLEEDEWARFRQAEREVAGLPLVVDDTVGLTIGQIRARARRMKRRHGIGLLVLDHLHLVSGKGDNRLQELTRISAGLKEIARELAIPTLALCQLNRGVEGRDDKRPQLSDLRESGSIEQDADVVMFLFRKCYYLERQQPQRKAGETDRAFMDRLADWHDECLQERNRAEISIQKNRHGTTGTVGLYCDLALSRFRDLAPGN